VAVRRDDEATLYSGGRAACGTLEMQVRIRDLLAKGIDPTTVDEETARVFKDTGKPGRPIAARNIAKPDGWSDPFMPTATPSAKRAKMTPHRPTNQHASSSSSRPMATREAGAHSINMTYTIYGQANGLSNSYAQQSNLAEQPTFANAEAFNQGSILKRFLRRPKQASRR